MLFVSKVVSEKGFFNLAIFFAYVSCIKLLCQINLFPLLLKGGLEGGKPQPHVIIPSAALAGSIISFILCPSELVKVSHMHGFLPSSCCSVILLKLCAPV